MTEYFYKNKDGKITFSEDSLRQLLDRVYNQGYNDGKHNDTIIWNSPSRWYNDWLNKPIITWYNDGNSSSTSTVGNTTTNSNDYSSTTSTVQLDCNDMSDLHIK